ncbi:MAG TPA: STN domain-containing protein, partial [Lacipirellulaceae bacterium]|nr:STN domain-containing protein [Lacipirellulaceae bacterium]
MHAGRTTRAGRGGALRVVAAAAWVALAPAGVGVRAPTPPESLPRLTVPAGPPPPAAPAPPPVSIEDAISAALRAAGVGNATAEGAPGHEAPEPLPRPNPFATGPLPAAPGVVAATQTPDGQSSLVVPLPGAQATENLNVTGDQDGLVSLVVREGSLRQVVGMIAQTQRLNIVFAGAGDAVVTAAFERQPWEKVLDSLLSATGHVWTRREGVIFISSVDAADYLPPDAGGLRVEVFDLDFVSAADVDQTIKGL